MDLLTKKDGFLSMIELINNSRGCSASDLPTIDPKEMAVIIFTSGTLGRAKGVMLSQQNIATDLSAMASMVHIPPSDRFLSVLPMHHTYECTCGFLCPLYCGASAHYAQSLRTISEDMQQVQATLVLGVPLLFDKMFKRIYQESKKNSFPSSSLHLSRSPTLLQNSVGRVRRKLFFRKFMKNSAGTFASLLQAAPPRSFRCKRIARTRF